MRSVSFSFRAVSAAALTGHRFHPRRGLQQFGHQLFGQERVRRSLVHQNLSLGAVIDQADRAMRAPLFQM